MFLLSLRHVPRLNSQFYYINYKQYVGMRQYEINTTVTDDDHARYRHTWYSTNEKRHHLYIITYLIFQQSRKCCYNN